MNKSVLLVALLALVGCTPRQDPGVPIPRSEPDASVQESGNKNYRRDSKEQTASPQTPTTPTPLSGQPLP